MKKILLISLIAINNIHTTTSGAFYILGFNTYTIFKCIHFFKNEKKFENADKKQELHLKLLDTSPSYASTINNLIKMYAPDNKNIKIYGTKKDSPLRKEEYFQYLNCSTTNNYILAYPKLQTALKNSGHQQHLLAQAIIGHEIGHVVCGDNRKLALGLITGTTFLFTHMLIKSFIPKMQNHNLILAMLIKHEIDRLIFTAYQRADERKADAHLIRCTQNPAILHAVKDFCREQAQQEIPHAFMLKTHPTFTERAETFAKAARELEEKLKN
ncbi:MAG: M48 family metalloprotease [Candidatus Babeliaceae bacterium]|jgi:hypothetical protein